MAKNYHVKGAIKDGQRSNKFYPTHADYVDNLDERIDEKMASSSQQPYNVIPIASSETFGAVKTGQNITNDNGTISITKENVVNALGYTPPENAEENSDKYSLPVAGSEILGGVKIGENILNDDGKISVPVATSSVVGATKIYDSTGTNSDGTITQAAITQALDTKAPLNSPALTGTPTAPTPAKNVSGSDRLATTAYVLSLLKNNPEIIDELLTAINGKLDKTTADSTYAKKTDTDNFLEKKSYNNFVQETNCKLTFTSGTESGIYFKKDGVTNSAFLRGDGNQMLISVGSRVNAYGSTGMEFRTADAPSSPGRVTIIGTELYFNSTKLA